MQNLEMLWMLCAVVATLVVGFVIVPKLKAKGWLNSDDVRFTGQLLEILGLVLDDVKFKDEKTKETTTAVVHVARVAVRYVGDVMDDSVSIDEKKKMAMAVSLEALGEFGIEVTDARKKLIEITVDTLIR